ncbi:MAG: hypothetical protein RIM72_16250 [Alphaproteobacteria bacterium]|jgi:hypothetical protein
MNGVEIRDKDPRGFLSFDLEQILECLGDAALRRVWRCTHLECSGEGADALELASEAIDPVDGERLLQLARSVLQVIDGEFAGYLPGQLHVSLRISAIDSSLWEVFGDDVTLNRIRAAFKDVRPIDPDERR